MLFSLSFTVFEIAKTVDAHTEQFSIGSEYTETQKQ
jgi:5-formaminoimidazole-4-carboxamide-1-beta-D-ribofuranosyl 5'-monophosphate synthetase